MAPSSQELEPPANPGRFTQPKLFKTRNGEWRLTTTERKGILLNNIYGVDVDRQAVEVTKLSLLLKVTEGETEQISQRDWIREHERILPDLAHNIRCGNSIVATDFYDAEQASLLPEPIKYRINAFDWETGFRQIVVQEEGSTASSAILPMLTSKVCLMRWHVMFLRSMIVQIIE
jgi:hypothetical protein